ncbi:PhzF family phenazine biosynthesis isomerase [Candidatus Bathyarchaeota archaeon]|nr:PhzF family phenazine biosynthesis isomerase [Candidatus Bathyarchaeota archaeon]
MVDWVDFYQIDAFTDKPFKGNPAAIFIMPTDMSEDLYLAISREMNLSETAFLENTGRGTYRLRWFTPTQEVPLCGHATLAAAYLLFNHHRVKQERIRFDTKSGPLFAENVSEGVLMNFPSNPPHRVDPPMQILEALGVEGWIDVQYSPGNQKLMIHLKSHESLLNVSPDFTALKEAKNSLGWRATMITASGFNDYDFVSRHFAPLMGVNEDPATGSNHTVLTPYWGNLLDKRRMRAYQASRRGGSIIVEDLGERVNLIGRCVLVLKGKMQIG